MNEDSKILLSIYKEEFENYKNFIDSNYWHDNVKINLKNGKRESSKLTTEVSIIDTIIKSTNKFKEDVGEDIDKKSIQDFIKFTSDIIKKHIDGIAEYKKLNPLKEDSTESEVEFHSDLFALITKTKVALSKLSIDENELSKKSLDLFFANEKAPLLMRETLCEKIPIIKDKTDNLPIDFSVPHINPATSNELLINMKPKDIPPYDPRKHFFEQEISTIQFWEEERIKIKNGINIQGYHLSDWLYWHTNIFKLAYGSDDDKAMKVALLRDNEYFFDYMYNKAGSDEYGRHGVFLYGTRRYSKSVVMTSKVLHRMWTINNAQGTIQGFSKIPDLVAIVTYATGAIQNMYPALKIKANSIDVDEGIYLGIKAKKVQDVYEFANINIVNLEGGTSKKGGQKTAAFTPDVFLLDEAGKGKCIVPWKAAMPSFAGGPRNKWRLVPMISGTAGEGELSVDAELMLKNPATYSIMPMDWDILEEFVDPDYVTWKRNNFGFFVPAQMSLEAPDKTLMQFGDFLQINKNNKFSDDTLSALNEIEIYNTDWKAANEFFTEKRKLVSNDISLLASETNSFPLDPEDCYVTTEVNKFPGLECKSRKSFIEQEGLVGQKYKLRKDSNGEIHADMTTDPVVSEYPYKGGNFDAPVVMLINPLLEKDKPPLGLFTLGFDDVKQEKSSGDSLLSATIYMRDYEGGEWANRFVAWYDSRPERKQDYYKTLYLLVKIFNARILAENEDNGFLEWMETNHMDDVYIHFSTGVGLASEENLNRNNNRKFGWSPTTLNIYRLEQKMVMYTKEDNVIVGGIEGLSGVDRINHPMLLEEMYKYKKDNNADRIRSAGLALTLAQYYDKTYQYMKKRKSKDENQETVTKRKSNGTRGLTDTKKLTKW
jgi:hypothetical protein